MGQHKILYYRYPFKDRQTNHDAIEKTLDEHCQEGYKVLSHQMSSVVLSVFFDEIAVQIILIKESAAESNNENPATIDFVEKKSSEIENQATIDFIKDLESKNSKPKTFDEYRKNL